MTLTGWNVFTQKDGNAPLLTGLSSTTKPASPPDKWLLFETDTAKGYYSLGGAWVLATGGIVPSESGYWTILTNGNLVTPEIIFAGGDVISFFVPT